MGLVGATQSLRLEHAGSGVGFSVVCPGFVAREGMHARAHEDGISAPAAFGTITPERVGRAVVRAIGRDLPEVLVTPRPIRPSLVLAAVAPRLAERLAGRLGITAYCRAVARLEGRL